jgi:hypothetical protein
VENMPFHKSVQDKERTYIVMSDEIVVSSEERRGFVTK